MKTKPDVVSHLYAVPNPEVRLIVSEFLKLESFKVTEEDEEEGDSESEEDAKCCVWNRTGSYCCPKGKICLCSKLLKLIFIQGPELSLQRGMRGKRRLKKRQEEMLRLVLS